MQATTIPGWLRYPSSSRLVIDFGRRHLLLDSSRSLLRRTDVTCGVPRQHLPSNCARKANVGDVATIHYTVRTPAWLWPS